MNRRAIVRELAAHVERKRERVLVGEGPAACPILFAVDVLGVVVALGGLTPEEHREAFGDGGAS